MIAARVVTGLAAPRKTLPYPIEVADEYGLAEV